MAGQYVTTVHPSGHVETVWTEMDPPPPPPPIRQITTQAFYRRLTPVERKALRTGTSDEVADFRDDLQRSPFVNLDGQIASQLQSVGTQPPRIVELLIDGVEAETQPG